MAGNVSLETADFNKIWDMSYRELLLYFLIVHHDCKKQAEWKRYIEKKQPLSNANINNIKYQQTIQETLMQRIKFYNNMNRKLSDSELAFKTSSKLIRDPNDMFLKIHEYFKNEQTCIIENTPKSTNGKKKTVTWAANIAQTKSNTPPQSTINAPNTPPASPPPRPQQDRVQHGGRSFIVYKKHNRKYIKPGGKIVYI